MLKRDKNIYIIMEGSVPTRAFLTKAKADYYCQGLLDEKTSIRTIRLIDD